MSKRLKLISTPEAEMEERCFPNPYPDWEQGDQSSDAESRNSEPLDEEGKVAFRTFQKRSELIKQESVAPS